MRVVSGKRRCRFHGGMSTGPRTKAGRARIAEAQRRRWRAFRSRKYWALPRFRGKAYDENFGHLLDWVERVNAALFMKFDEMFDE